MSSLVSFPRIAGFLSFCLVFTSGLAQPRKFIDPANMDLSVKPGDDFYTYASGTWVKNNPVPAKETRWGSFNQLREFNIQAVRRLLEKAAANTQAGPASVDRRVGDFFAAGMDSALLEKRGLEPLQPVLSRIAAIADKPGLAKEMTRLRKESLASPFYSLYVAQDRKHVNDMRVHLGSGGLSLPDRDFYLKTDAISQEAQKALQAYMKQLFVLRGIPEAEAESAAKRLYSLEKSLAGAHLSRVEMRDPYKTYNKWKLEDLSGKTPQISWRPVLAELGIRSEDSVIVAHVPFLVRVDSILAATPLPDLKMFLDWNVLRNAAPNLNQAFFDASFRFGQVLSGQKIPTPRWQRISQLTDGSIGDLLGQLFVAEHFRPEAKARMDELVENLRKAFGIRIKALEWMSPATKEKALAKLAAFRPKVGYPSTWKNYEGLVIDRTRHFENVNGAGKWAFDFMVGQLGKPVDRDRWGMTAPTVNAYYNSTLNEIVFPAGILQFPFFDPRADDAVNYGGIGAVIGHEMSHGFDDKGSQYDADGTLRNWWTEEDRKKFEARTKALGAQFDGYRVQDTLKVNGALTMGENIGDLGGLNVAYEAFKMTQQGKSKEKIDGFTPDQRFFLSWAQVWRGNILPRTEAQFLITDPHSPGRFRTIGAPVNMDAWYDAFGVKPGDKLYKKPEDRIRIW